MQGFYLYFHIGTFPLRLRRVCLIHVRLIISYDFDNITSTKWPEDDEDIPTYTLEFFDGWQPPELNEPVSRQESPQPAPSQVNLHIKHSFCNLIDR